MGCFGPESKEYISNGLLQHIASFLNQRPSIIDTKKGQT